ncbi:MAG: hypothetical protein HZC22_11340 [Rhodocyclales bacterium]|nr:hypothetical protein [Rhodocyclales bacterium]
MPTRLLASLLAAIGFAASAPLFAQDHEAVLEIKRLQTLLAVINAELKADLDQMLTLNEALKANARPSLEAGGQSPDVASVADVQAAQRRAIAREAAINARLDAILARSATLDASKQPLMERIRELSVGLQPAATPATQPGYGSARP